MISFLVSKLFFPQHTQVLLNELRADNTQESCRRLISHGLGQKGLSRAGRSVENYALWWFDANLLVELGICERKFNWFLGGGGLSWKIMTHTKKKEETQKQLYRLAFRQQWECLFKIHISCPFKFTLVVSGLHFSSKKRQHFSINPRKPVFLELSPSCLCKIFISCPL